MLFSAVLIEAQPDGVPPFVLHGPIVVVGDTDDEGSKAALAAGMAAGKVTPDNMPRTEVHMARYFQAYARFRGNGND